MPVTSEWARGLCCLLLTVPAIASDPSYPADAVVDVTKAPWGAIPDDGRDDTEALQRAITAHVGTSRILFLPAGTYDLNGPLVSKSAEGKWVPFLHLRGQGRTRTVLRLRDRCPGFADAAAPRAVLSTCSLWQEGDKLEGGGNKAFGNYLFDLAIDTGSGNPGAIGLAYAVSNFGAIRRVDVRSGDGQGVAGISQRRSIPGPGLLSEVAIDGFAVGLDTGDVQYGMTIDGLRLRGQSLAGIRVEDNVLHIRGLESVNRGPAVLVTGRSGMVTLIDSRLEGGAADQRAIDCAGTLLLRGVTTAGYHPSAVRSRGVEVPGPSYAGWSSGGGDAAAALLKIEDPPAFGDDDPAEWTAVGARLAGEADDTRAIQRALDATRGTVYFPQRHYFLSDTLVVRGAVRRVFGFGAEINLGAAKEPFSERANPRPLFRLDPTTHPVLFLEGLFLNAQFPGEVIFENNTPATVVIRHCAGWIGAEGHRRSYRNTARATGPLFVEDVFMPGWEFTGQQVWARQFNPENMDADGTAPQVLNRGGTLWILGFKTEGPAPYIATVAGGATELLGAYNYVSATDAPVVPAVGVPYLVEGGSRVALTFATDNFRDSDYPVYVRDGKHGLRAADLPPRNGTAGDRSLAVPLLRLAPPAP